MGALLAAIKSAILRRFARKGAVIYPAGVNPHPFQDFSLLDYLLRAVIEWRGYVVCRTVDLPPPPPTAASADERWIVMGREDEVALLAASLESTGRAGRIVGALVDVPEAVGGDIGSIKVVGTFNDLEQVAENARFAGRPLTGIVTSGRRDSLATRVALARRLGLQWRQI